MIADATEQQQLAGTLGSWRATSALDALAVASASAAAAPTLVLWMDAWVRLPSAVVWLALITWPACAALAVTCCALAARARKRFQARVRVSRPLARLHFQGDRPPRRSDILGALAAGLSAPIWLHAIAPQVVAWELLTVVMTAWAVLMAAAAASRARGMPA